MNELSKPPYCGLFALFLLFEHKSNDEELLKQAIANTEDQKMDAWEAMMYLEGEDLMEQEFDENYRMEVSE